MTMVIVCDLNLCILWYRLLLKDVTNFQGASVTTDGGGTGQRVRGPTMTEICEVDM